MGTIAMHVCTLDKTIRALRSLPMDCGTPYMGHYFCLATRVSLGR